jgi:PAS domain S-box-containing protein
MQAMEAAGGVTPEGFEDIVAQLPAALILIDRQGIVRAWNRGAENVFGFSAAEAIGHGLDMIIPAHLRAAHDRGFQRAMASGHTQYAGRVLTTRAMHKDGTRRYVDLSFSLLHDRAGVLQGALAIGRDCTERFLAEKALRERVRALEAKAAPG